MCRQDYEKKFDVYWFKCIFTKTQQLFKDAFKLNKAPTVIFFREHEAFKRFEDNDEPDNDPKLHTLRTYLDELCTGEN